MQSADFHGWVEVGDRSYYRIQIGNISMAFTTRLGGRSSAPYTGFNLAEHVGDEHSQVCANRQLLKDDLDLPVKPMWLNQVHGVDVARWQHADQTLAADACFSDQIDQVCAVMTADCIPLLAFSADTNRVVAVHAGWRGLADGIVQNALALLGKGSTVAIGPHISQANFQVGAEVREQFIAQQQAWEAFFIADSADKYRADLAGICRSIIIQNDGEIIATPFDCTFANHEKYFSYRRDGETGRMASLIWRQ